MEKAMSCWVGQMCVQFLCLLVLISCHFHVRYTWLILWKVGEWKSLLFTKKNLHMHLPSICCTLFMEAAHLFLYLLYEFGEGMPLFLAWSSIYVLYRWLCLELNFYINYRYLSALISQSFLDIGSVSRILDGIMKLCLQFCWNIENQENSPNTSELEHITEVPLLIFSHMVWVVQKYRNKHFIQSCYFSSGFRFINLRRPSCVKLVLITLLIFQLDFCTFTPDSNAAIWRCWISKFQDSIVIFYPLPWEVAFHNVSIFSGWPSSFEFSWDYPMGENLVVAILAIMYIREVTFAYHEKSVFLKQSHFSKSLEIQSVSKVVTCSTEGWQTTVCVRNKIKKSVCFKSCHLLCLKGLYQETKGKGLHRNSSLN